MDLEALFRSSWYHPSLSQGLFDGPIRLYFHPKDEGLALKLYFRLIAELNAWRNSHPDWCWPEGQYFLVFLIPQGLGSETPQRLEFSWGRLTLLPLQEGAETERSQFLTREFYDELWRHSSPAAVLPVAEMSAI